MSCFYMGAMLCFWSAMLMSSTYTEKNNLVVSEQISISQLSTSSHSSPKKKSNFFPTVSLPLDVRTGFVRVELLGPKCLTMILSICVMDFVSSKSDILISEIWAVWKRLPFSPEWTQLLHRLLVHHSLVVLQWRPITFAAVICDADEPYSVNTACAPASSFTMSPRSTTRPFLTSGILFPNWAFLRWPKSISDAKWTLLLFSVLTD